LTLISNGGIIIIEIRKGCDSMNELKNLFYYENVSPRLANNIKRILNKNLTFEQLAKYKNVLLKKLVSKSLKQELLEMLEITK
jgi:hypothetical protein